MVMLTYPTATMMMKQQGMESFRALDKQHLAVLIESNRVNNFSTKLNGTPELTVIYLLFPWS
jgi:hypothetical protein